MSQVIALPAATTEKTAVNSSVGYPPAVRTETVYVVFTTIDETLAAVRVARKLARGLGVPLTIIHFRTVPFALPVDRPTGISPIETEDFLARVREEGVDARVRVYLCRDERRTSPMAFKPHSLIVMGGQHSWLPTHLERWRRALEAAGHAVVFVDSSAQKESSRA